MDRIEAQYTQVDFKALLDFCMIYVQSEENIYGPVYSRMVKEYTIQFAAEKLGEKVPEDSDKWDWPQIKKYLEKRLEKYPYIFNALLYASGKVEASLQGGTATSRVMAAKVAQRLDTSKSDGLNLIQIWKQTVNTWISFRVMPPETNYSIENENTIKLIVNNCPFKDSCEAFIAENITNRDGSRICGVGRGLSSDIGRKILTGCDYFLEDFANPGCTVRLLRIL